MNRNSNGFYSDVSQHIAHMWLISNLKKYVDLGAFVDLGCGNGDLISQIETYIPRTKGMGVDLLLYEDTKWHHPKVTIKNIVSVTQKDVAKFHGTPIATFALVAEQRFTDTYANKESAIINIANFANALFVYNYTTEYVEWIDFIENFEKVMNEFNMKEEG